MLLAATLVLLASSPADPLAEAFKNPPASAKPHTWWHWMDGNVTAKGITADLEAMKQVGIGGAQMFAVSQSIPKGPVDYMSPKWREMIQHAVKEADRLGLELCIHNCAGWSSSGGPWVKPEDAMQVIAWSTVETSGPVHYSESLPMPKAPQVYAEVPYYKDIAVFAIRTHQPLPKPELGRTGVVREDGLQPDWSRFSPKPEDQVLNITDKLDSKGLLNWNVPDGQWTILRMGHVPTGKDNHPAPPSGDGLEVDKLSREALKRFWNGMMGKIISDIGPLAGKVLNNALIDSYEVGSQNWTPKMREEFLKRRGYDPLPYLPAIAGVMIGTPEKTERFLWDYRRTIADLYADNYYGYFGELCHQHGLKFSTEPYGNGGFDNIQAGGKADIPMGEFWTDGAAMETTKLAASVGHIYGRPVIGAESFTADIINGRWLEEPYALKALGDTVFCNGINRYIFHRYALQPWNDLVPGMTMGPWGTHLERTQTWWTEAASWMKYIARCQYLLQKGHFVADALYFEGEGAPADLPFREGLKPALPNGYDYDGCDTSILKRLQVKKGRLTLPSGMIYRVLILPESRFMTPEVASKIARLVQAGAVVVGSKPQMSPSLVNFPVCDAQVQAIADKVWAVGDKPHSYGKGRVFPRTALATALEYAKARPDFTYKGTTSLAKLSFIHRSLGDTQIFFVANRRYWPTSAECTFRVQGLKPELWHADTGQIEDAPVFRSGPNGTTVVPLTFEPAESVFVVFRKRSNDRHLTSLTPVAGSDQSMDLPKIQILKARYETEDGRGIDVTKTVADAVNEGIYDIPASNGIFGDPVLNVVKRLRVEYVFNGKSMTQTVPENNTLHLMPKRTAPVAMPAYQLNSGTILGWRPATYRAKFSDGKSTQFELPAPKSMEVSGPWKLRFQVNRGAPPSADFAKLISWPDSSDPGIKYFSGSAVYSKNVTVPADMLARGRAVVLDLGRVKNFATVSVNGKELAVLWKEPFRVDVTHALKAGKNRLDVKVTNLWVNRLIGDEHLPPDADWNGMTLKGWPDWLVKGLPRPKTGRVTFTTWKFWGDGSPLLESGLLGPVVLRSAKGVSLR